MARKLEKRLKGFILWELEHYPENKKQLEQYRNDLIESKDYTIDGQPRGTDVGDPTSRKVERLENSRYIRQAETTIEAIERVLKRLPPEKVKAIDLMYWKGTHTATGAGMVTMVDRATIYRWIDEIAIRIAIELGYYNNCDKNATNEG